jgi:hypothetical protein
MNKFYVYIHIRLDNMQPFYVGKGCGKRKISKLGRSKLWHDIVNKYGFKIEVIAEKLEEKEAYNIEKNIIYEYKKIYQLTNKTNGGGGSSGWKHTEITKMKQKEGLIKSYTPELKEIRKLWMINNQPTKRPEVREKMKKPKTSNLGSDHFRAKSVKHNNVIYPTISAFCKLTNLSYTTYKWRFKNSKLSNFGIELI